METALSDIDRYIHAATRDNTRKSYRAAIEHFEVSWGGFLPATADSITHYLADYADNLSINTLRQRLAGIAAWANTQDWDTKSLMEYVGWKDVQSAMRYIEVADPFSQQLLANSQTTKADAD